MKKIIYFVLLTFSLSAYQNDFLLADGVTCPQANEAALKKLAEVFKPKEDLLLILSGASKAKGVDPRKFPVPGADGKIETVDFVETLAELVQKHSNAIAAIEEATRECNSGGGRTRQNDRFSRLFFIGCSFAR